MANQPWTYGAPKKDPQKNMETYAASILQGGQDYDDIMARYRAIADKGLGPDGNGLQRKYTDLIKGGNYNPNKLSYQRGPELTSAFRNLSEYSRTGGISGAEEASIRARGISPIRSVYANAQQNLNRSRTLGGGYSPNYAASTAKMSRDLSENLASASTNVEAGIAQARQQGRLSMAPQYASYATRETENMGGIDAQNEENRYRAAALNRSGQSEGIGGLMGLYGNQRDREMEALRGMSGMYGAAPGMAQLYGNQALQRKQLDQNEEPQGLSRAYGGSMIPGGQSQYQSNRTRRPGQWY